MKNITFYHFKELQKQGISLDKVFLLGLVENGDDIISLCTSSPKLKLLIDTLLRKGFITEKGELTIQGGEILKFLQTESVKTPLSLKIDKPEDFDLWWKTYPGTDTFVHKGVIFTGTRGLRTKKEDCKTKFNNILNEGEYTIKELIDALSLEIHQKKENSVKEKTNKLKFMQNSLTYLNQRTFEPFIELVRQGIKVKETQPSSGGSVDI
jgi:hypothetical protein